MISDRLFIGIWSTLVGVGLIGTVAVMIGVAAKPAEMPFLYATPRAGFQGSFIARNALLTLFEWTRFHLLRTSPQTIVLGSRGWLYYRSEARDDGHSLDDFMGRVQPDVPTLARWRETLVRRRDALEGRGIRYLPFVAPSTATIYPENLPRSIRSRQGPTRLDAVMAAMPTEILDLRPLLRQRRAVEEVYDGGDTHWNDLGAFQAYGALTDRLREWFPSIRPVPIEELRQVPALRNRELEALMLGYQFGEPINPWLFGPPQSSTYLEASRMFAARCQDSGEPVLAPGSIRERKAVNALVRDWVWLKSECPSRIWLQPDEHLPTAVIFHDSFMIALNPFLSQNFRRVRYVLGRYDAKLVESESPDVVLDEVAERYLDQLFR